MYALRKPIKACQGKGQGALLLREWPRHSPLESGHAVPFSLQDFGSLCEFVSSHPQHCGPCRPESVSVTCNNVSVKNQDWHTSNCFNRSLRGNKKYKYCGSVWCSWLPMRFKKTASSEFYTLTQDTLSKKLLGVGVTPPEQVLTSPSPSGSKIQ